MNAHDAAEKIRPSFHLESMPTEDRHHVLFVEAVAAELGVAPTAFNLHQVDEALDKADIHRDSDEYPKMLFSRQHHANENVAGASVYDPRHDYVWVHVANEDEAKALGSGWVDNPAELPERGDIPVDAPPMEVTTHHWSHEGLPLGGQNAIAGVGMQSGLYPQGQQSTNALNKYSQGQRQFDPDVQSAPAPKFEGQR